MNKMSISWEQNVFYDKLYKTRALVIFAVFNVLLFSVQKFEKLKIIIHICGQRLCILNPAGPLI